MTFITIVSSHTHVVPQIHGEYMMKCPLDEIIVRFRKHYIDTRYDTLYVYTYLHDAHQNQH